MARQKKYRILEFFIHQHMMQYGLFVDEEQYPLENEKRTRHVLRKPYGIKRLMNKKFTVDAVDTFSSLDIPLVIDGMTPFMCRVYWNIAGIWNQKKDTQLKILEDENKNLIAEVSECKARMTNMIGENRAFKAELERLKEHKQKQNILFPPKIGGDDE